MQYRLLITHIKWVFWESEIVLLPSAAISVQAACGQLCCLFPKADEPVSISMHYLSQTKHISVQVR